MRLDQYLVYYFQIESRSKAKWLIENGKVKVEGNIVQKPAMEVSEELKVEIEFDRAYEIGRGYSKLKNFLCNTSIDLFGKTVLDAGASTGGFTACALDFGAKCVYAVDVGSMQLHPKLREDHRVISFENTDIRKFNFCSFNPIPDVVLMDISFISLTKIFPVFHQSCLKNAEYIVLIKPQFETEKKLRLKNGIITSSSKRQKILKGILEELREKYKANILKLIPTMPEDSKTKNVEYFVYFKFQ